ncbi:MAG: hypothetical protein ACOCQL_00075 [Halolamina sp.]
MPPLQMFGMGSLAGLVLALVIPLVIVVFGVLGALLTFFGASRWQDVSVAEEE